MRFALDQEDVVDLFRFRSDWWSKRPDNWEMWVSSSEQVGPGNGATFVASGTARAHPWECVAGESCASTDVPDECCPAGRQAVQMPPQQNIAKWDDHPLPATLGRVWWFRVRDTHDGHHLHLDDVEFYASNDCVSSSAD